MQLLSSQFQTVFVFKCDSGGYSSKCVSVSVTRQKQKTHYCYQTSLYSQSLNWSKPVLNIIIYLLEFLIWISQFSCII